MMKIYSRNIVGDKMSNQIEDLLIGDVISSEKIREIFLCSTQSGMNYSKRTNTLVLISNHTKLYGDREKDGIYYFTGKGQSGDQKLTAENRRLAYMHESDMKVYFFKVMEKAKYTFVGEVELIDTPYTEKQRDREGLMRDVWIFPLKSIKDKNIWMSDIESFESSVQGDRQIANTEKEAMVKLRIGHSGFKDKLVNRECICAMCSVDERSFLIASHIKPWSKSNHQERLDVHNGLLLCPNHDALFDKGYITFDEDGAIIISSELKNTTKIFMNIREDTRIKVTSEMKKYLEWHRSELFKR